MVLVWFNKSQRLGVFKETIGALSNNSSGFNHETLGFDLIHEELAIYSNYSLYMPLYASIYKDGQFRALPI
jgi:hypothetical protein